MIGPIATFLSPILKFVSTPECLKSYFNGDLTDVCLKKTIASCLSLGIMLGALLIKFPQIIAILKSGTVAGLSEASLVIELFSALMHVGYNYLKQYPFESWGDMAFVTIQCAMLVALYWWIAPGRYLKRMAIFLAFAGACTFIFCGFFPLEYVDTLAILPIPVILIARVPQILQNFSQGHTGPLSFATCFLSFGGNVARVFTTIELSPDATLILFSHAMCAILNAILFTQIIMYRRKTAEVLANVNKKKAQ